MVRRKACRGELPVPLQETIEILVLMASGEDEESQKAALQTLQSWPPEELQKVLRNPATPVDVLDFAAKNLAPDQKELGDTLLHNPALPDPLREWLKDALALIAEAEISEPSESSTPLSPPGQNVDSSREEAKATTVLQKTQRMSVVQKVKAALIGTQEERLILVRDTNKLVARAVMQSPKLSEHEVESFASMKDICDEALRLIAQNRRYMKLYAVVRALVNNPRTPIDIGLQLLKRTHDQDLKYLAFNRNISDVIRRGAEKMVRQKQEATRPKIPGKH